jgi:hypothetical protein
MQSLALLSVVPLVGILFMGAIFTRETWVGGRAWNTTKERENLWR